MALLKVVLPPTGGIARTLFSSYSANYSLQKSNAIKLYLQEIDFEVISSSLADELQQKRKLYSQVTNANPLPSV